MSSRRAPSGDAARPRQRARRGRRRGPARGDVDAWSGRRAVEPLGVRQDRAAGGSRRRRRSRWSGRPPGGRRASASTLTSANRALVVTAEVSHRRPHAARLPLNRTSVRIILEAVACAPTPPPSTEAVLDRLLAEPSLARGVVHHEVMPAREASSAVAGLARSAHRPGSRTAASSGCTSTRRRPSRRSTPARTSSSSRRPRRASRCATPCRSSRPSPRTRPRGRCSCSRPRRSARTRSRSSRELARRPGSTSSARRRTTATRRPRSGPIRTAGQVVVTNPDMLHSAILPHHTKWFQLFEQLRSSSSTSCTRTAACSAATSPTSSAPAAAVRPLRLDPVIVCCSATIGNPASSPRRSPAGRSGHRPQRRAGRRAHVLLVDPAGHRARPGCARLGPDPRPALGAAVPARRPPDDRVRAVAGRGRDPADRACARPCARASGRAAACAATAAATCPRSGGRSSAACATARSSASSPPTRSSWASTSAASTSRSWPATRARSPATWQQIGRAGRRQGVSVGVLVASGAPVDQYVIHHPEFLLEGTPEEARLDPDNLHVLLAHLRAATFELPFEPGEVFGPARPTTCSRSSPRRATSARPTTAAGTGRARTSRRPRSRCARRAGERRHHRHDAGPAAGPRRGRPVLAPRSSSTSRRSTSTSRVQYYVDRLDWGERKAYVHTVDVDHYTYANRAVTLKPLEVFAEAPATGGGRRIHGEVMVASLVTLFKKLKFVTDENVGWGPIDLPELELQTTAYWLTAEPGDSPLAARRARRRAARRRAGDPDRREPSC